MLGCERLLQVILLILKIIGIMILIILGILLIFLLSVLFFPLRYRIIAEKNQNIYAYCTVNWLFRVLNFNIEFKDEKLIYSLKLFIFTIKSNQTKEKHKSFEKQKNRKPKAKQEKQNTKDSTREMIIKEIPTVFVQQMDEEINGVIDGNVTQKYDVKISEISHQEENKNVEANEREGEQQKRWSKLWNSMVLILKKIKAIPIGVFKNFKGFREKIKHIFKLIKNIHNKIHLIYQFFQDEENKVGIKYSFKSLMKLLKHIKPRKLSVNLNFGTGDPCTTGQVLAVVAVLQPFLAGSVAIAPDFEEEIIEGTLKAKGRILVITVLLICFKLYRNREFKILWNNGRKLKEEL